MPPRHRLRHSHHPESADAGAVPESTIRAWFTGALQPSWAGPSPTIDIDRDEIVVVLDLPDPPGLDDANDEAARAALLDGYLTGLRESTRQQRMSIAEQAQHRFGRTVSWGASAAGTSVLFTHLALPTMTRLRQSERRVLDTLVEAGVARSRSDALAWCVRLVGEHSEAWLADLRAALADVERLRHQGPS